VEDILTLICQAVSHPDMARATFLQALEEVEVLEVLLTQDEAQRGDDFSGCSKVGRKPRLEQERKQFIDDAIPTILRAGESVSVDMWLVINPV
jgi:hypothetical protein